MVRFEELSTKEVSPVGAGLLATISNCGVNDVAATDRVYVRAAQIKVDEYFCVRRPALWLARALVARQPKVMPPFVTA